MLGFMTIAGAAANTGCLAKYAYVLGIMNTFSCVTYTAFLHTGFKRVGLQIYYKETACATEDI